MNKNPSTTSWARRFASVAVGWLTLSNVGCESTSASTATCTGCVIEIVPVASIGNSSDMAMLPGRPLGMYETESGTYFINVLDAFPVIYRPFEKVVVPIGPEGKGPGEFQFPSVAAELPADSVLVSEIFKFTVMTADGKVSRQIRSREPLQSIAVVEWPTNVWATSRPYDQRTGTNRNIIVRYDFTTDSVVGLDTVMMSAAAGGPEFVNHLWRAGRADSSGLWLARYNAYRLIRFDEFGTPQDTLIRQLDWFPGNEPDRVPGPDRKTSPHMLGNWVEGDSLLWTVVEQPRENAQAAWADIPRTPSGLSEIRVSTLPAPYRLSRSIVEVFDLRTEELLASEVFDGFIISVLKGNRVVSYTETDAGVPVVHIHAVSMRRSK